ncbi:hypothetical protein KK083_29405 [Fulvivirgaceae bacterium PWU4]|uniref:Secreted protein n=1 Tax=Chryseosolibacter histidini TaxID=2782349 RepID=A0AAP2GM24_9BACT|nr:DUF6520 family protein [Chryseosolibacter histidini]MBT1701046.1 hypothetical protein [Chryseosolibacter histidini]
MKKSKIALSIFAFVFAIAGAFASESLFTNDSKYQISGAGDCSSTFQTVQNNCSTANGGLQCTVNTTGTPLAWDVTNCSSALNRP